MALRLNVVNTSRQQFNFNAGGEDLQVNLDFNTVAGAWFIGLAVDGQQVFIGRRLVSSIDLSPGHPGGVLYARDSSDNNTDVSYTDLVNGNSRLYYITQAEIDEIGQRNPTTIDAASNVLPENFVDGGSIGVPISQFNSLQQTVTQQAQTISELANTVGVVEQKCEAVEQSVTALTQAIASLRTKEVSFSFNDVLEDNTVVASWPSTKAYTLAEVPTPTATGINRGSSNEPASGGNASFDLYKKPVSGNPVLFGTVVDVEDTPEPVFSIEEETMVAPGDTIEVHSNEMNGLSGASFTLQLTE